MLDDVETIKNDFCVWKELASQWNISSRHIHRDKLYLLSDFQWLLPKVVSYSSLAAIIKDGYEFVCLIICLLYTSARIAILSALAVGLRSAFIGLPNIQPITAMFFVSVLYLGLVDGFLIMALTMSISGFIFGFGPWIFNQILAFGILMALWSLIAPRLSLVWQIALVTILSFLYGVLLDYSYGLLFKSGLTFVVSGLLYDTYHAVSTLLFYPFIQSIFRRLLK